VKITPWGIWFDIQGLIYFAILLALSVLVNIFAIPIAPSFFMRFGGVVNQLISVCFGPIWYTLPLISSVVYVSIFIHGDFLGLLLAVISTVWVSVLDKYFHPLLALYPSQLARLLSYFYNTFISGYPQQLGLQLLLRGFFNAAITTLLFTLVIVIPNIYKILPLRYDSWVASYWLLKMDETPPIQVE
jgi:predicted membrane protein